MQLGMIGLGVVYDLQQEAVQAIAKDQKAASRRHSWAENAAAQGNA